MAFPALWGPAICSVKIGILSLYIAVFRANQAFKVMTYVLIVFVLCYGVSVVVAGMTMCRPMAKQFDPSIKGTCGNVTQFYMITSGLNLAFDLVIFVWPLPMLWGLQVRYLTFPVLVLQNLITNYRVKMKTRRKVELSLLFGLGFM